MEIAACIRAAVGVAALTVTPVLSAQGTRVAGAGAHPRMPEIVTSASGEARLTPDRASLSVGVQTEAVTAAAAARANARRQRAVIDTLRAMGIPAARIGTADFNIFPQQTGGTEAHPPKTTGYRVVNTVRVEIRDIASAGALIDAALAKGANGVNSLEFYSSAADSVRRVALTEALGHARADAEALASGAGGHLGELLQATTTQGAVPRPFAAPGVMMSRAVAQTPITAGEQTVTAFVTTRWRFVPGRVH